MVTPINLNKARKQRARAARAQQAEENRLRHGRTKAEKEAERLRTKRLETGLDGHQRETE
jgi:hypothetical protein